CKNDHNISFLRKLNVTLTSVVSATLYEDIPMGYTNKTTNIKCFELSTKLHKIDLCGNEIYENKIWLDYTFTFLCIKSVRKIRICNIYKPSVITCFFRLLNHLTN